MWAKHVDAVYGQFSDAGSTPAASTILFTGFTCTYFLHPTQFCLDGAELGQMISFNTSMWFAIVLELRWA